MRIYIKTICSLSAVSFVQLCVYLATAARLLLYDFIVIAICSLLEMSKPVWLHNTQSKNISDIIFVKGLDLAVRLYINRENNTFLFHLFIVLGLFGFVF